MPEPDNQQLLQGCRLGTPGARESFVRRYAGLVRWAVAKTLSECRAHAVDADDVFQEVFRKIFSPGVLEAVRDAGAVKSWLVVIACRAALDAGRAHSRRSEREAPLDEVLEADEELVCGDELFERVAGEDAVLAVREAIELLPPRERACVRFYYLCGLKQARIGEIMGIPVNTVSTILRRCRESLRVGLERRGYGKGSV